MNTGEGPPWSGVEHLVVDVGEVESVSYTLKFTIRDPRVYIHTTNVGGTLIGVVVLVSTEEQIIW